MNIWDYIKDKAVVILVNITGLMVLSGFIWLSGCSKESVCLIIIAWLFLLLILGSVDFYRRRKHFKHIHNVLNQLDKRYLIAEMVTPGYRLEDKLYFEIMRKSNKSIMDTVNELEREQRDYREYLESWVHDVKTPITSLELICANNPDENTKQIQSELGKINNMIDIILYYARMEKAYKDYHIHEVDLKKTVVMAIQSNKQYFLQNQMQVMLEMEETLVSTDEKWVEFLLTQIFTNAMKYRKEENAYVKIYTKPQKNQMQLMIEDNGIGIAKEDIGRIFEKGFTGKNGRTGKKSTGMGLYLCRELCDKLDIGIFCESVEGEYTRIGLIFPDADFSKIV